VILAEGSLGILESKTACCVLRYRPNDVVAVIDSRLAGKEAGEVLGIGMGIPIVASIEETAPLSPNELLIGIAPRGGVLPETWREIIRRAIAREMNIVSGLHTFIGDDPEFASLAADQGVTIWDIRKPPPSIPVGLARARGVPATVVLTVGTDCDVGKFTVSWEIYRGARERGIDAGFVATGQTGVYISGKGVVVDAVKADFIAGAVEEMILDVSSGKNLVIVEGQGSLLHPGYSGVTLGLIHGTMPDGFILCHLPSRREITDYGIPLPGLDRWIELYESSVADIKAAPVLGIALNCFDMGPEETRDLISRVEEETGLPTTDPVKYGVERLMEPIRKAVRRG
jgi:uncharacterized NAD-dependent epimerase/dehydratase family protein